MIETFNLSFSAGEVKTLLLPGNYFSLQAAPGGPVTVELKDRSGGLVARLSAVDAPFFAKGGLFEAVQITSASAQTVGFIIGDGEAASQRISGVVTIANQLSTYVGAAKTVTSADGQLLAANAARRHLLIQNNHPTGSIFVTFGVAATLVLGIKIIPGGNFEMTGPVSTQEIRAIGDTASNAAIVAVEG